MAKTVYPKFYLDFEWRGWLIRDAFVFAHKRHVLVLVEARSVVIRVADVEAHGYYGDETWAEKYILIKTTYASF